MVAGQEQARTDRGGELGEGDILGVLDRRDTRNPSRTTKPAR